MKRVREVLRLHEMQLSVRKICKAAGVSKSTVSDYIARFKASGLHVKGISSIDDETLHHHLFPEQRSFIAPKKVLPDYEYIHQQLKERKRNKVTLMLLWEEYKRDHPDGYAYTQFRVHYHRYKQRLNPSMRQVHLAGEKVFVDYSGLTMPIYDAFTGEVIKAQIFVAVLGASGYTFVHASHSQKKEDFIHAHVLAYHFFGGTPRIVVPDNLKSAISSHTKKEIVVNESYADLARHYTMVVEPARPYKPKDKAKAEQGVQGIQRYILARLRHHRFYDINELNDAIGTLLDDYNNKVVKYLGKSRTEMFETLDKPHLNPLPANQYVYKEFKIARVDQDYHVALLHCRYSVPYEYLKAEVELRYSSQQVEVYHNNTMIATHPRLHRKGEVSTLSEHMPPHHRYQEEKMNPERLRSWAKNIGPHTLTFVEEVFKNVEHPPNAYRKIIGILSLSKIYGQSELELALMYGLREGTTRRQSIQSILDKKLYLTKSANNTPTTAPSLFNHHANLRGADEYQ